MDDEYEVVSLRDVILVEEDDDGSSAETLFMIKASVDTNKESDNE